MRYEFDADRSLVRARMHAFLHTATAETTAVNGWFDIESGEAPLDGPVEGVAEVAVGDFDFGNPLLATMARQWIKERSRPVLHFDLRSASGTDDDATVTGDLTIGDRTNAISADARLERDGDDLVVAGTWALSQRSFRLVTPPGVRDRVDIEFRLVAAPRP